jgi:hypothetical protein
MASRLILPFADVGRGITPSDGAQLFFFDTNANTLRDTWADKALTTLNTNPVIANADGVFPDIWISGTYKIQLKDKNDVLQNPGEWDPVEDLGDGSSITLDINGSSVNLEKYLDSIDVASYDDFRTDANGFEIASVPDGTTINFTNDGIAGSFVAKSGAATDNAGTIIVSSVDSNRYVERIYQGAVYPRWFEAIGDDVNDDTAALQNLISFYRANDVSIDWEGLVYRSSQAFNLTGLGTLTSVWEGGGARINFFNMGNAASCVDLSDTKEPVWNDIIIFSEGSLDAVASTLPFVGVLSARDAAGDFAGRHRWKNVKISGFYQLASYYNYGTEENTYERLTVANGYRDARSAVITASNHLSATSDFITLYALSISTTQNTFIQPSFTSAGAGGRENVAIRGAGGMVMLNPYSSSGFTAHISLQAIDQAVSGIDMLDYQFEVDRTPGVGTNASYAIRIEGDGTKDATNVNIQEQLSTLSTDIGIRVEDVRFLKRFHSSISDKFRVETGSTQLRNCNIEADAGVETSNAVSAYGGCFYAEDITTITLPAIGSVDVTALDYPIRAECGRVKQNSTSANALTMDAQVVKISNAGGADVNTLSGGNNITNLNIQRYYIQKANAAHTVVFKHNVDNILVSSAADYTLGATELLEVIYFPSDDKWHIKA